MWVNHPQFLLYHKVLQDETLKQRGRRVGRGARKREEAVLGFPDCWADLSDFLLGCVSLLSSWFWSMEFLGLLRVLLVPGRRLQTVRQRAEGSHIQSRSYGEFHQVLSKSKLPRLPSTREGTSDLTLIGCVIPPANTGSSCAGCLLRRPAVRQSKGWSLGPWT